MIGIDPVPQFPPGEIFVTPGASCKLGMVDVKLAIARHVSGNVTEQDGYGNGDTAAGTNASITFWSCASGSDPTPSGSITGLAAGPSWFGSTSITGLNVAGLTSLQSLTISESSITSLNVSGFASLTSLNVQEGSLVSLNVSGCTGLTDINTGPYDTSLASINLTGCTSLTSLEISYTALTNLNLTTCTALTSVQAESTNLTTVNASGLTDLTSLDFYWTHSLGTLNVSGDTALATLNLGGTNLTNFNIIGSAMAASQSTLNTFYATLPTSSGTLHIGSAGMAMGSNTSIATGLGWTVTD